MACTRYKCFNKAKQTYLEKVVEKVETVVKRAVTVFVEFATNDAILNITGLYAGALGIACACAAAVAGAGAAAVAAAGAAAAGIGAAGAAAAGIGAGIAAAATFAAGCVAVVLDLFRN